MKFTELTSAQQDVLTLKELAQHASDPTQTKAVLLYIHGTFARSDAIQLNDVTVKLFASDVVEVEEASNRLATVAGSSENVSLKYLRLLIGAGADINMITRQEIPWGDELVRVNALHMAAYIGNIERIRLFLEAGANVHVLAVCSDPQESKRAVLRNADAFARINGHDDVKKLLKTWVKLNKIIADSNNPEQCVLEGLRCFLDSYKALPSAFISKIDTIIMRIAEPSSNQLMTASKAPDQHLYELIAMLKNFINTDLKLEDDKDLKSNENKSNLKIICNRLVKYLNDESQKHVAKQDTEKTGTNPNQHLYPDVSIFKAQALDPITIKVNDLRDQYQQYGTANHVFDKIKVILNENTHFSYKAYTAIADVIRHLYYNDIFQDLTKELIEILITKFLNDCPATPISFWDRTWPWLRNIGNIGRGMSAKISPAELDGKEVVIKNFLEEDEHIISFIVENATLKLGIYHFIIESMGRTETPRYGLIMPRAREDLLSVINKQEIEAKQQIKYAIQIALALHFIHTVVNIVHGDITPENVLIDDVGNAKVSDLGLACQRGTQWKYGTGHLGYAAPERLSAAKYDTPSDVFSLGMLCFTMAFREIPFNHVCNKAMAHGKNPSTAIYKDIIRGNKPCNVQVFKEKFLGMYLGYIQKVVDCWEIIPEDRPPLDGKNGFINTMQSELGCVSEKLTFK